VLGRHAVLAALGVSGSLFAREAILYIGYVAIAVCGAVAAIRTGALDRAHLGLLRARWRLALVLFVLAFLWTAGSYGGRLFHAWWINAPDLAHVVAHTRDRLGDTRLAQAGPGAPAVVAVGIGRFFNAVAEELIYRGLLLGALRKRFGPLRAVALSSLVFFAAHAIVYGYGWHPWFLFAGFLYGVVFAASHSLFAAVATHWGFNFGIFAVEIAVLG
jgi:membrane protease YdiL (CAAX protease family)